MLNVNKSYYYSLYIYEILDKRNNKFIKWKKFINLLIRIFQNNNLIIYFYIKYKYNFLKKIFIILNDNIILSKEMKNFVIIIFEDNILNIIPYIYENFINIYLYKKKILIVNIYSRYSLNKENINKIRKIVRKRKNNYRIFFFLKKDLKIIAGFKVYVNNLIFELNIFKTIKKINLIFSKN